MYRYTYRGETYEQIGNVPAMEEQARKKVGTELTLFIDPAKPTSFYCLEEEKGYFQQRLAYLIVALLVHCGFDYDWSHVANNIASVPAAAKPAARTVS